MCEFETDATASGVPAATIAGLHFNDVRKLLEVLVEDISRFWSPNRDTQIAVATSVRFTMRPSKSEKT